MLVIPSSTPNIVAYIESLQPMEGEVIMVLIGEHNPPDIPALIQILNRKNIAFFGGIFPGVIHANKSMTEGCIIKKFKILWEPFLTTGIASTQFDGFPENNYPEHLGPGTAIVLLDGLSNNANKFLDCINELLSEHCFFIGGGAGSISLQQKPCIFNNEGFVHDAAVVCVIDNRVQLGVRHGWQHLAGPLVATQTEGNTILQLNWEPALDVYNKIVENDGGVKLNSSNFASIAQGYPFGMLREKKDDLVRDPLAIGENNSIICIGEVPPNTVLYVLKGDPKVLLQAAQKAMYDCGQKTGTPIPATNTFVVDCITRSLFLDHQFSQELNLIRSNLIIEDPEQEPFGILSLGEIASYGNGLLEVFNKTIVVGTFQ